MARESFETTNNSESLENENSGLSGFLKRIFKSWLGKLFKGFNFDQLPTNFEELSNSELPQSEYIKQNFQDGLPEPVQKFMDAYLNSQTGKQVDRLKFVSRTTKRVSTEAIWPHIQKQLAATKGYWDGQNPLVISLGVPDTKIVTLVPKSKYISNPNDSGSYIAYLGRGSLGKGATKLGNISGSNQTPPGNMAITADKNQHKLARYAIGNFVPISAKLPGVALTMIGLEAENKNLTTREIMMHGSQNQEGLAKGDNNSAGCFRFEYGFGAFVSGLVNHYGKVNFYATDERLA